MKKVGNKVVVVGLGAVGVSYAYSMLNQALCDDMVLIDINRTRTEGGARLPPRNALCRFACTHLRRRLR